MTYSEISPALRGYLGTWQAMRKLGFRAGDIYFVTAMSARHRKLSVFAVLRTQGKELKVEVAHVDDEDLAQAEYQRVSTAVSKGEVSWGDLGRMLEECEAFQMSALFVSTIVGKGFALPGSGTN